MSRLPALVLALAIAGTAAAQNCSLTITGSGAPNTSLSFAFQGAPRSPALLVIGDTQGTTTLNFGSLGSLTLGLAQPFVAAPLGFTDATGAVTRDVHVPGNVPSSDLFGQGVGITFAPPPNLGLGFCTTSVVPFHVGA
jgi:hypothetical protein